MKKLFFTTIIILCVQTLYSQSVKFQLIEKCINESDEKNDSIKKQKCIRKYKKIETRTVNLNDMSRTIEESLDKGKYIFSIIGEFEKGKYYINYSQGTTTVLIDPIQTEISKENDSLITTHSLFSEKDFFNKTFEITMGSRSKFELSIHVIKKENDSITQKHKIVYKSKVKRKWLTSLGVSSNFIKSNTFRSLKQDDDTYKIIKDGNNQKLQVIPLMQFSFINLEKDNDFCFTGGIGFDTENISAFTGLTYYVGQNIFLTAGVSLHKQKQLNNLYNENQILTEAIDESIINKDYYRINPFISFTYRLSSNIFKK